MPISIVFGKPGSGKSLFAVGRLVRELVETPRYVVTNLPLRLGELNHYIQRQYPDLPSCILDRITVLDDDQVGRFWEFRGPDTITQAVAYFVDEAHIKFNARDWAQCRRECINYLSQHRKLGDVVYAITQSPGNLDKQFRSVAEDFTRLSNGYTRQMGVFRARGVFYTQSFYSEPQGNTEAYHKGTFTLDPEGLAKCYDTAKGIGIQGSTADIGRRAKGIPALWAFPAAIALGLCCLAIPFALGRGLEHKTKSLAAAATRPGLIARAVSAVTPVAPPRSVAVAPVIRDEVFVRAFVIMGSEAHVWLSDGTDFEGPGVLMVGGSFFNVPGRGILPIHRSHVQPMLAPTAQPAATPPKGST